MLGLPSRAASDLCTITENVKCDHVCKYGQIIYFQMCKYVYQSLWKWEHSF